MVKLGMMSPTFTPLRPWPESPTMLAMSTVMTTYGLLALAVAWQIVTLWSGSGEVAEAKDAVAPRAPTAMTRTVAIRADFRSITALQGFAIGLMNSERF